MSFANPELSASKVHPWQPEFWVDENGEHPPPLTMISTEDIKAGRYTPVVETDSPVCLTPVLWPNHCEYIDDLNQRNNE